MESLFPGMPVWLVEQIDQTLRVLLGFLLGAVLGYEREVVQRPAGLRTHMLVSGGMAAFTVAAIYGFGGYSAPVPGGIARDPVRLAGHAVAGVGFLGAGTIWRTNDAVRGLTTAASIWLVAAIGLLAGAGLPFLAVVTTITGFVTLRWLRPASRRRAVRLRIGEPSIVGSDDDENGEGEVEERIIS